MKKILFIVPLPPPVTGMAVASKLIYDEIKKTESLELINYSKNNFKQGLSSSFGRIIKIIKMLSSVLQMRNKVDEVYFTITQSVAGNMRDLLVLWLLRKKKMTIHLHGGGIKSTVFDRSKILKLLNEKVFKYVDNIIVLGESLRDCYEGMGVDDKICIVPNSADNTLFLNDAGIKEKYEHGKIKVLFLSNLIYGKGHLELVNAVKNLSPAVKGKIEVQFVGGFETDEKKTEFLESIKFEETIKYLGIKKGDDRYPLFSESQIFCLPTYYPYEGQPVSILEAYASGCCVITTKHNGIVDIFEDKKNGFVVEKKSVESLSDVLTTISKIDPKELYEIGKHNHIQAISMYTNDKFISNMKKVLFNA